MVTMIASQIIKKSQYLPLDFFAVSMFNNFGKDRVANYLFQYQ